MYTACVVLIISTEQKILIFSEAFHISRIYVYIFIRGKRAVDAATENTGKQEYAVTKHRDNDNNNRSERVVNFDGRIGRWKRQKESGSFKKVRLWRYLLRKKKRELLLKHRKSEEAIAI